MKSRKFNKIFVSLVFTALLFCGGGLFYNTEVAHADERVKVTYALPLGDCRIENYQASYTVLDPDGERVSTKDGRFIAKKIGTYTVSNQGVVIEEIIVLGAMPTSDFTFDEMPSEICAGERLLIPKVSVRSKYQTVNAYNVDVLKEGELIQTFENVNDSFKHAFTESGIFSVRFWFEDIFGVVEECKVDFEVIEAPIVVFEKELSENSPTFVEYDVGEAYGFYKDYYTVDVKVNAPNGEEVSVVNNCFTPVTEGEYTIVASFKLGEQTISAERKVQTYHSTASLFNEGKNVTNLQENVSVPEGSLKEGSGIEFTLDGSGAHVYYNEIIDLKTLDKEDSVISFYIDSEKSNVNKIKVTLIDVNDANNRFSVYWNQNLWNHAYTYMLVNYDNYSLGISNEEYNFGLPRETFGAVLGNTSFLLNKNILPFNFSYSCAEKAVYTNCSATDNALLKILDLDDSSALGERKIFKGFSEDKVYLKIELEELKTADLVVTHIGGKSVAEEVDIVNDNYLRYSYDGRYIGKDSALYDGAIQCAYQLPVPIGNDIINGALKTSVQLSYLGQDVSSLLDDKLQFTPTNVGVYTVKYTAKDYKGNSLEHSFDIEIKETAPEITLLTGDVEYRLNDYVTPPEISFEGGTGEIHLLKTYLYNEEIIQPDINGKILLNEKGKVTIKVKLTDFLGKTVEKSIYIRVDDDVRDIVIEEKPTSFFVNVETVIPDFAAIDYRFNESDAEYYMSKTILVNGAELSDDRKYTFTSAGEYTIKYIGGRGTANEISEEFIVNVLPVDKLNNYPAEAYITTQSHVDKILFESGLAFKATEDFTIKMPFAIPISDFSVELSTISDYTNYTHINFYMQDYHNPDKAVRITLYPTSDGKFRIAVNDGNKQYLNSRAENCSSTILGGYGISDKTVHTTLFKVIENERIITSNTNVKISSIKEFLSGDAFVGFDKGLVEVSIEVCGVTADSVFVLNSMSNVKFTTIAFEEGDVKGPIIGVLGKNEQVTLQDEIRLLPAVSYDLLQGKCTFVSCYVLSPSGQKTEFDGNVGGKITATEFGNYKLVYISEDRFGNISKLEQNVECRDNLPPKIQLPQIAGEYGVNSVLEKMDFTATDNAKLLRKYVLIRKPSGELTVLSEKTTLNAKGVYSLLFYAEDVQGNFTIVQKDIEVK